MLGHLIHLHRWPQDISKIESNTFKLSGAKQARQSMQQATVDACERDSSFCSLFPLFFRFWFFILDFYILDLVYFLKKTVENIFFIFTFQVRLNGCIVFQCKTSGFCCLPDFRSRTSRFICENCLSSPTSALVIVIVFLWKRKVVLELQYRAEINCLMFN